ncbi:diguanylate cyclase domain-containing protein [Sulfuricaulis limicola]|uniref:diguanylate cyclase domain-containing protein n=1 Tax=Sulfuricaulis limicola TaxID=1620215 RepID=UPI001552B1B5|nr:diguanylate cyclase [Sulfuricaulis limicola]
MMFTDENVIELAPRHHESNCPREKSKILAMVHPISVHQWAEGAQQWLAMIVGSSSDAIIGKSSEGIILSWNPAAKRLFGYSAAAAIGRPVSMLFPRDGTDEIRSLLQRSGRGEQIECHETECIRQDGKRVGVSLSLSPIRDKTGAIVGTATIARDITERRRIENRLHQLAFHDVLTGLPNRFLFRERVCQAFAQARRHDFQVALLFIDLDRFKQINDSLGHQIGDRLLQVTASRLRRCLREGDVIARLGGDEFVVGLTALTDSSDATLIAGKILETLREPFLVGSHELNISASIGIGIYPADGQDMETLMQAADTAMYQAKKQGRGNCQLASALGAMTPSSESSPCHDCQSRGGGKACEDFHVAAPLSRMDPDRDSFAGEREFNDGNQPIPGNMP